MNKTTTALTDAIIKGREIASEHPYKIVGKPDTYNQYNEAWQDCADIYEQLLISLLQKEREDAIDFANKCLMEANSPNGYAPPSLIFNDKFTQYQP